MDKELPFLPNVLLTKIQQFLASSVREVVRFRMVNKQYNAAGLQVSLEHLDLQVPRQFVYGAVSFFFVMSSSLFSTLVLG